MKSTQFVLGQHVGTFGDQSWHLNDMSTYATLPPELQQDQDLEMRKKKMAKVQETSIKKNVIESWKGKS